MRGKFMLQAFTAAYRAPLRPPLFCSMPLSGLSGGYVVASLAAILAPTRRGHAPAGCSGRLPGPLQRSAPILARSVRDFRHIRQAEQHIAMTGEGRAPADQIAPAQLVQSTERGCCHSHRSMRLAVGLQLDREWVRPLALRQSMPSDRTANVDPAGLSAGAP